MSILQFIYFSLLSQERAAVKDVDGAKPLKLEGGCIKFDNVHFRWALSVFVGILLSNGAFVLKIFNDGLIILQYCQTMSLLHKVFMRAKFERH